jgi:peptidoglycan/LPS O-acetylase OafA/YrhL
VNALVAGVCPNAAALFSFNIRLGGLIVIANRSRALDGLRGYAALIVLPFHMITGLEQGMVQRVLHPPAYELGSWHDAGLKLCLTLLNGQAAVCLFFLLSGYVLLQSVQRDLGQGSAPLVGIAFVLRRICRLYPPLAIVVLVTWWLSYFTAKYGVMPVLISDEAIDNLKLGSFHVNGASWTLRVEFLAVPCILLFGLLARHLGTMGTVASVASVLAILVAQNGGMIFGFAELAHYLLYFAVGGLAGTNYGKRLAIKTAPIPFPFLVILFILPRQLFDPEALSTAICESAIGLAMMCRAIYRPPAFLLRSSSQFLGRISYSFYLWNVPLLMAALAVAHRFPAMAASPIKWGLALSILVGIPSLFIAAASERWIEQPSIVFGRKIGGAITSIEPWFRSLLQRSGKEYLSKLERLRIFSRSRFVNQSVVEIYGELH